MRSARTYTPRKVDYQVKLLGEDGGSRTGGGIGAEGINRQS